MLFWVQGELSYVLAHNEQRQPVVEQLIGYKTEAIIELIYALGKPAHKTIARNRG